MKTGENGETGVQMVHAPDTEKKFVANCFGINRKLVIHNHFIILGPASAPAKIRGSQTPPRYVRSSG